jgi:large subunit ribosomal protein L3
MMIQSLIGKKIDQTQGFLEDGTRVPLSIISVADNIVTQVKSEEHEGYSAVQLGFDIRKKPNKPTLGHIKKAGTENAPRFFREIRLDEASDLNHGSKLSIGQVFEIGDIVDIEGTSKGKGFAGVVKRHGFRGGPRTHGQSDRERAPGSIGQTTTPGRVYRGKRMAGRMGNAQVTIKNLEVLGIEGDRLYVKGLIPGARGSMVIITRVGKNKKFTPLYSEKKTEEEARSQVEDKEPKEAAEVKAEENKKTETVEESSEEPKVEISTQDASESDPQAQDKTSEALVEEMPKEDKENAS